jgi:phosphatidylcholine synthase
MAEGDGAGPLRRPLNAVPAATLRAYATHALTASGALLAMLALLAAIDGRWMAMFGWLGVAFIVDGIDGPLARRFDVREKAPIVDGVLLDLVVDYLTYVFVPVYALLRADFLPGRSGSALALVLLVASALYFADTRMKTADRSFSGFPACWNMVVVVLFATRPSTPVVFGVLVVLGVAMFLPVRFVHPVRTRRWRPLTLPLALVWLGLAGAATLTDFAQGPLLTLSLVVTSFALLLAGPAQQVLDRRMPVERAI